MNLKYIYIMMIGMCFGIACQDEEAVTPREAVLESRFKFPQGNDEWDKTAREIRDEFGVFLIYTGFDTLSLRRQWSTGSSLYYGDTLTDEQAASHVKFMKEHVFAYLNPEITKQALPLYYYLAYNYGSLSFGSFSASCNSFDGLDFWVSSIYLEKEPTISTWEQYRNRRYRNLRYIFLKIYERGNVVASKEFHDGFDYTSEISSTVSAPNYFKKRGFCGLANGDNIVIQGIYSISLMTPELNFLVYINVCMRYKQDEFEVAFPKEDFPMIHEKRKFVIKYMKEKYNVDLEAIAQGPEL